MDYHAISMFLVLFVACGYADEFPFDRNYSPQWGGDHLSVLDQGREVQLLIDEHSGAGFHSKQDFGSGYFRLMMKLPGNHSQGIITTFYLTSIPVGGQATIHDEFDFEFLGGHNPMAYRLNTNVFVNDQGHREQQFRLWFDPTADFHKYELFWNQYYIGFFIDGTPIRVFKNNSNIGVSYPSKSMHIEASIWNSTEWQGPVDWTQGPFIAHYQGFSIDGCNYDALNPAACNDWNPHKDRELSPDQQRRYRDARKKYMVYDYCSNTPKHFTECLVDLPVEERIEEDMNNMRFNPSSNWDETSTLRKGATTFVPSARDAFGHIHKEINE